jgi:hypothetical protein
MKNYFIYKNLNKKCFSIKFDGKVIKHVNSFVAYNCHFKVNSKGRQKAINEGVRNVHAFLVAENVEEIESRPHIDLPLKISYNPWKFDYFYVKNENNRPIHHSSMVLGLNGNEIKGSNNETE